MAIGNLYVWCDDFIGIVWMHDNYSNHDDRRDIHYNIDYDVLDFRY
jgi:hypothetical protein